MQTSRSTESRISDLGGSSTDDAPMLAALESFAGHGRLFIAATALGDDDLAAKAERSARIEVLKAASRPALHEEDLQLKRYLVDEYRRRFGHVGAFTILMAEAACAADEAALRLIGIVRRGS